MNRYFQQEISNLKELGAEFSEAHPAIAPMLSGPSADPDVERLLEGVAFLTAMLRQKLDDEFPEIIHELVHLIWPIICGRCRPPRSWRLLPSPLSNSL